MLPAEMIDLCEESFLLDIADEVYRSQFVIYRRVVRFFAPLPLRTPAVGPAVENEAQ